MTRGRGWTTLGIVLHRIAYGPAGFLCCGRNRFKPAPRKFWVNGQNIIRREYQCLVCKKKYLFVPSFLKGDKP